MQIPQKLLDKLNKIEKDCLELKKKGDLTENGQGQLDLIENIKNFLENN